MKHKYSKTWLFADKMRKIRTAMSFVPVLTLLVTAATKDWSIQLMHTKVMLVLCGVAFVVYYSLRKYRL